MREFSSLCWIRTDVAADVLFLAHFLLAHFLSFKSQQSTSEDDVRHEAAAAAVLQLLADSFMVQFFLV